jgi:dTDP-4-amino-4,6-dideoxygalactose transaminase
MKIIQAPRASTILYNLLTSWKQTRPWLMPANICPIVPITFMKAQVPFVLVDISALSLHMDLDQAGALIERREFGGLLYTHTYGDESTPVEFFGFVKSIDPALIIVDDRCLCIPGFEADTPADVVLFSTGYAKIVELAFGGYALMGAGVEYQPASLPFHSRANGELEAEYNSAVTERRRFEYRDSNWLMTDIDLPAWDDYRQQIERGREASLARRKILNEVYASRVPERIQLPPAYQNWRFNIRVGEKQKILNAIFEAGLFASSHYASLAGIMVEGRAPAAEALADGVINLFNDHNFTAEMADRACDAILKAI